MIGRTRIPSFSVLFYSGFVSNATMSDEVLTDIRMYSRRKSLVIAM